MPYSLLFFLLFFISCEENPSNQEVGEYLFREEKELYAPLSPLKERILAPYPWQSKNPDELSPITKYHLRCRGTITRPLKKAKSGEVYLEDCNGSLAHSLPIKNGQEYVAPILLTLLNYLQQTLKKPVVITSGHCCPTHQKYLMGSPHITPSKHLTGEEVRFYVKDFEEKPYQVLTQIQKFYSNEGPLLRNFERYPLSKTDVSTEPWLNKEIFIKFFKTHEGRNEDNQHPYPYFSIQVRWDRSKNEWISVNWKEVESYYRY